MSQRRCWGFRIWTEHIQYLAEELEQGRLRQGWGYDERQDLRNFTFDGGAGRNRRMLDVKKGDLLLVPRLPEWHRVSIVEATEDWNSGYRFEIAHEIGDLGHIFPARPVKSFARANKEVTGEVRATLRNPSRFWNIDRLVSDIRRLCEARADLGSWETPLARAQDIVTAVFSETLNRDGAFKKKIFARLNDSLEGKDWEEVLKAVLIARYPSGSVTVVQGRSEAHHGTDILVRLPDITGELRYAIAIQVKDHVGTVSADSVKQIGKADHWLEHGLTVIQRVVIFTRATRGDNAHVAELEKTDQGLQIVFGDALARILDQWARHHAARTLA